MEFGRIFRDGGRRWPPLPDRLARQLSAVPMSDGLYHPAAVSLRDGRRLDCVYLCEARPWFERWGRWPDQDGGKASLDINDVDEIADSPSRLPAELAHQLYEAGESGMGYTIFTVRFRDGASMPLVAGNAIDFVDYPPGQSPETILEVLPHVGRDDPYLQQAPKYHWCLFDGSFEPLSAA